MDSQAQPFLGAQITGALAWWRDAGVDLDFSDQLVSWLAAKPEATSAGDARRNGNADARAAAPGQPPAHVGAKAPELAVAPMGGERSEWPKSLDGFAAWWLNEPSLDGGQVRGRVTPRGPGGADLMIIVPHPEAEDDQHLLSGPQGIWLARMLAAMEIGVDQVYFAAALPRHTPMADWAALESAGLGAILSHHIGLVAPQRIIAFGTTILPLLGHNSSQSAKDLQSFYHEGSTVPLLGDRDLDALAGRSRWKAGFWHRWLDWTGTKTA